jgi:PDZ domain-containing secreted protein
VIRAIQIKQTAKTVIVHLWKKFHRTDSLSAENYLNNSGASDSEKVKSFQDSQMMISEKPRNAA